MRNESQINVTSTTANGHEGEGQEHKGLEEKKLSIVKRQEDQRHGGHRWAVREMRTMRAWFSAAHSQFVLIFCRE